MSDEPTSAKSTADDAVETATATPADATAVRRPWLRMPRVSWQQAVVLAVAVALITACVTLGLRIHDQDRDQSRRDEAVAVARDQALRLLTIDGDNVEQRINHLLENSTGDFRRQLSSIRKTFGDVVQEGGVKSTGSVDMAAVSEANSSEATVLLALSSTVRNRKTKKPESRAYRIAVDLVWRSDRWLVSRIEFSP